MSWKSGSSLMDAIVKAVHKEVVHEASRFRVYVAVIAAFEQEDCDTLYHCIGIDPAFDSAYWATHPHESGAKAFRDGKPRDSNPYQESAHDAGRQPWFNGWDEAQQNP